MSRCSECDGSWGGIPDHGVGQCCVDNVLERLMRELEAERKAKEEARGIAVACLRYGEVCECEAFITKHCYGEACVLPWETS